MLTLSPPQTCHDQIRRGASTHTPSPHGEQLDREIDLAGFDHAHHGAEISAVMRWLPLDTSL
jgi:hypothetical protein